MLKAFLFLPMQLQKASLLGWAARWAKHTPCEMNARWYTLVLVGGVCSVWAWPTKRCTRGTTGDR